MLNQYGKKHTKYLTPVMTCSLLSYTNYSCISPWAEIKRKQAHHLCSERQFPLQRRQVREKTLVFKHSGDVIANEIKPDIESTIFT